MDKETADQFSDAINRQEEILTEVKKLRTSNRLLRGIVAVLLAVLVGVAVLVVSEVRVANQANSAAGSAQQALAATQNLLQQFKDQTTANNLAGCQFRNGASQATRDAIKAVILKQQDALNQFATSDAAKAAIQKYTDDQLSAIPDPTKQDRDCTVPPDGLGPDDYPAG